MNHDIHIVDGIEIPFSSNWSSIAISLSGGADSALLGYLLCELAERCNQQITIHVISHIRMWKTRPWQQYDAIKVYDHLKNKFPTLTFVRHTNFIAPDIEHGFIGDSIVDEHNKLASGDNIQIRSFSEYICFYHKIDAYYNAVTRNPKNVDFVGMVSRDIELSKENKHLQLMNYMDKVVSHPFRFVEKSWIFKQYKNKNILDLFNITRSCEGEFNGLNFQTYVPGQEVPICGECFWCKEREWAIEQNK